MFGRLTFENGARDVRFNDSHILSILFYLYDPGNKLHHFCYNEKHAVPVEIRRRPVESAMTSRHLVLLFFFVASGDAWCPLEEWRAGS